MQIQVIKDKLPELVKEKEKIINYAECKNNELFLEMLVNQVGSACNQFFNKPTVENIIEIQLVLDAILDANGISQETYSQIREEIVNQMGTYSNRFIGFFQESAAQADTETNA
jgi:predicted house-cleaning noncanonical NTP pyrophosphatase (MazG superfamily)